MVYRKTSSPPQKSGIVFGWYVVSVSHITIDKQLMQANVGVYMVIVKVQLRERR